MNTYKIVYTINDDLVRHFIQVTAESRQAAIDSFLGNSAKLGLLNNKIVSCRVTKKAIPAGAKA